MKVVILAGGKGTRLGNLTQNTPKPFLKVSGRPFVLYLKDYLQRFGFSDIYLSLGHNAQNIETNILEQFSGTVIEDVPLGTGGALKLCVNYFKLNEPFILMNGDTFQPLNLKRLLMLQSKRVKKYGLVNLQVVEETDRYSNVIVDDETVLEFGGNVNDSAIKRINSGVYLLNPSIAEQIQDGFVSLEDDIFPALAREGSLGYLSWQTPFIDIGIPTDFNRTTNFMKQNKLDKLLFLDRDGVLIKDTGYPSEFKVNHVNKNIIKLLSKASELNYRIFVISNQAGVARGKFTEETVESINANIQKYYLEKGVFIEKFLYCPHHKDGIVLKYQKNCASRKPGIGMLEKVAINFNVDKSKSFLIGDNITDIQAANKFGIKSYLVKTFPFSQADINGISELIC